MSKQNTELLVLNNRLRRGEGSDRAGVTKVKQCAMIHEVIHHRPHQQEY